MTNSTRPPNTAPLEEKLAWQKIRIIEICKNFELYCEKNLKIRDKDGNLVPFIPNSIQRKFVAGVMEDIAAGLPVRYIILKARQMGMSTVIEALIFWWTATHQNVSATITAHEQSAALNIYEMFRRFYDNALEPFQPELKYNTKHDLTFDKLKSQLMTASAENKQSGRSRTNQILHNSEVAFWPNGQELVAALLQTVPMRPKTMVFHESTANGIGGYFYDTWQAAKRGDSDLKPVFYAWYDLDEYRHALPEGGITLTDAEREMAEQYNLNDEQIMWYRLKLREFGNDLDRMRQEYPSNDVEAFIASGRPRFDIKALLQYEKGCEVGQYIDLKFDEPTKTYKWSEIPKGPLQVWKLPDRLGQYVLGGDVAEGLEHGDYSVITIIDKKNMETVARWRGHCDPDMLGDIAFDLGTWYSTALVGIEVNNHGLTTLQRLKDRGYSNLYRRERNYDRALYDTPAATLGWKTDLRTKPLMIDYLAQAIREGSLSDYDITFVREAMTYVVDDQGRTNAQEGCFDDAVISTAIALQMFQWSFTNGDPARVIVPSHTAKQLNRQTPSLRPDIRFGGQAQG